MLGSPFTSGAGVLLVGAEVAGRLVVGRFVVGRFVVGRLDDGGMLVTRGELEALEDELGGPADRLRPDDWPGVADSGVDEPGVDERGPDDCADVDDGVAETGRDVVRGVAETGRDVVRGVAAADGSPEREPSGPLAPVVVHPATSSTPITPAATAPRAAARPDRRASCAPGIGRSRSPIDSPAQKPARTTARDYDIALSGRAERHGEQVPRRLRRRGARHYTQRFREVGDIAAEMLAAVEADELQVAGILTTPDGELIRAVVGWILPWPANAEFKLLVDAVTLAASAKQRDQRILAGTLTVLATITVGLILTSLE